MRAICEPRLVAPRYPNSEPATWRPWIPLSRNVTVAARSELTGGSEKRCVSRMVVAAERSLLHARRAGRPREIAHAALLIDSGMDAGPTPVGKAVPRLRELHA